MTDLRTQPGVAREIGLLIMYAANLEILFVSILAKLMGDDATLPSIIAIQVDNITAKVDILFDVAEQKAGDPFADAVFAEKDSIRKAVAFRNKLAHGLYVFDVATNQFELFTNLLTNRRGKPKCDPLTPSVVEFHREMLREAVARIVIAAGGLWNPLGGGPIQ